MLELGKDIGGEKLDWKWFRHKEEEPHVNDYNRGCPHCGRCPTCGRILWPTPHGPQPCHPRTIWGAMRNDVRGVYEDGMGLFVAID